MSPPGWGRHCIVGVCSRRIGNHKDRFFLYSLLICFILFSSFFLHIEKKKKGILGISSKIEDGGMLLITNVFFSLSLCGCCSLSQSLGQFFSFSLYESFALSQRTKTFFKPCTSMLSVFLSSLTLHQWTLGASTICVGLALGPAPM